MERRRVGEAGSPFEQQFKRRGIMCVECAGERGRVAVPLLLHLFFFIFLFFFFRAFDVRSEGQDEMKVGSRALTTTNMLHLL